MIRGQGGIEKYLRFSSSFSFQSGPRYTYAARKFQDHAAPPVRVSLRGWSIFFSHAAKTGTVTSEEGDDRAGKGRGGGGGVLAGGNKKGADCWIGGKLLFI